MTTRAKKPVMNIVQAIETYQCPGCVNGPPGPTCPNFKITDRGCSGHVAGTLQVGPAGMIKEYLGVPKGFCRVGHNTGSGPGLAVVESIDDHLELYSNLKTMYSIPVWKHLDKNGNTCTRWFSPRTNVGWTMIFLGSVLSHSVLDRAIEVTQEQVDWMD